MFLWFWDFNGSHDSPGICFNDLILVLGNPTTVGEDFMSPDQYQKLAERTECDQFQSYKRLVAATDPHVPRTVHAVIGMSGEVGELSVAVERWIYYGQGLDRTNVIEELGDLLWYVAEMCNALDVSMEKVMELNIAKLRKRYPEKYTDEQAAEENRDRQAEREVLNTGEQFQHDGSPFSGPLVHQCEPIKQTGEPPTDPHLCSDDLPPYVDIEFRKCSDLHDHYCGFCAKSFGETRPEECQGIRADSLYKDCYFNMLAERKVVDLESRLLHYRKCKPPRNEVARHVLGYVWGDERRTMALDYIERMEKRDAETVE